MPSDHACADPVDNGRDLTKVDDQQRRPLEAPLLEFPTEEENQADLVDALVKIHDPIAFERGCKEVAKKLQVKHAAVAKAVAKRRSELDVATSAAQNRPNVDELAASARRIINAENVLGLFAAQIGQLIVGEEKNTKLLYLVATSRLFAKPMHAAIKGPSSGGKSEIRKRVLEFIPPEDVISFTSVSEKALLYMPEDFGHKILSMGEAITGKEIDFQDYLLRELMSEGVLRYPTVQTIDGQRVTTIIEKNGPVAFMVTTTRNKLNPENETRMLSLEVNDSEEQTRAVLGKVAVVEGLNRKPAAIDLEPWHDYQRWLAAGECQVLIPFAGALSDLIKATRSVRLRRDFTQLLTAIKAHALLHRTHRRISNGMIVAAIEDYAVVRGLLADVLATASEVKPRLTTIETVQAVGKLTADDPNSGATAQQIASELGLDRTATWRRLKAAEDAGFIMNVETVKGRPGRYRGTGEKPLGSELLPAISLLRQAYEAESEGLEAP